MLGVVNNTEKFIGFLTGISILIFIFLCLGFSSDTSLLLLPLDVLNGLAFSFAFGFGFPVWLAYITSIALLCILFYIGYLIGVKVYRTIRKPY